jgi:hypothetical protein
MAEALARLLAQPACSMCLEYCHCATAEAENLDKGAVKETEAPKLIGRAKAVRTRNFDVVFCTKSREWRYIGRATIQSGC